MISRFAYYGPLTARGDGTRAQLYARVHVNGRRDDQLHPRDDNKVTADSFLSLCLG